MATLERSRTLYVEQCGGCHNVPLPAAKNEQEWSVVLDEMASKTKMSRPMRAQVEAYLYSACAPEVVQSARVAR